MKEDVKQQGAKGKGAEDKGKIRGQNKRARARAKPQTNILPHEQPCTTRYKENISR